MFNPFKKKKDDFSLNDLTLPSLGDVNNNQPTEPSLDLNQSISNPKESEIVNPNQNPFADNLSANNSFNSLANTTPTFSNNNSNNNINSTSNLNEDLINTKIENTNAKLSLIDSKIDRVENKLDLIYRILLEEISDTTKQKLNIKNIESDLNNRLR